MPPRYIGLALYAEGPTDYPFHSRILFRETEDLCISLGCSVELAPIQSLEPPPSDEPRSLAKRIVAAASAARGCFDLLFLHQDGAGGSAKARRDRIEPGSALMAELGTGGVVVPVVPVRETEAWALVDGDALRSAFGGEHSDEELGLPGRARDVEKILDPKRTLDLAWQRVAGKRRAKKTKAARYLEQIAERIRLERLRDLPAFQALETDLGAALRLLLPGR